MKQPWRRICCAVDLSVPSRAALAQAASLAASMDAELLVVHVTKERPRASGAPFAPPAHGESADAPAGPELDAWVEDARRAAPLTTSVELVGEPAAEIVRYARELACDVIVLGTHGRTGLRRVALGSVAEAVLRSAPCPVLVIRPPDAP